MQDEYLLASSDSDEDDEGKDFRGEPSIESTPVSSISISSAEIMQQGSLESRNKHCLTKMLQLEQPSITPKMIDFLLQTGKFRS